jgi:MFS transporter, PAT family, beta-lactamase induction signal transducer AmpG
MTDQKSFLNLIKALTTRRMLVVLLLGFSSGLPIMLVASTLKVWLRREGIDLSTIGFMSWLMTPYSFNFLWAPLLDRYTLGSVGRRRSWMLLTQVGLFAAIFALGFANPASSLTLILVLGFIISLFSATQDVAIDAYRREILPDNELGTGAALGVYGYRIAMLVASGFALWIVDKDTLGLTFNQSFMIVSAFMAVGLLTTLFVAREPEAESKPTSLKTAVVEPFLEFFKRHGAIVILLFILMFKMGDAIAGSMLSPFYVDLGYQNKDIAEVAKFFGFASSMAGLFIGGALIYKLGIYPCLWIFGILQALSTGFFALLSVSQPTWGLLAGVVAFEDLSGGMGTAALVAFMSTMANKKFTATQYALFSSLASFGRTFFAGFAGKLITAVGYTNFFLLCSALALPGLILLHFMIKLQKSEGPQKKGLEAA